MRARLGTLDSDDNFFEQHAQKFFAVPVGCGRSEPGAFEIAAEREARAALLRAQDAGTLLLSARKFCVGRFQFSQAVLPLGFQASRNESILSINGAITALGALGFIVLAFNFSAELG